MTEETVQYLRLIGHIRQDNRVVLQPSYLTKSPRFAEDRSSSPVTAELLDDDGKLLLRHGLSAEPYFVNAGTSDVLALRADLPFPSGTRLVRLLRKEVVIEEIEVSKRAPKVELTWSPPPKAEGEVKIGWKGSHAEKRPLAYFLRYAYDGGETWRRIGRCTKDSSQVVDFDQLPGGKRCRLALLATDGVNTTVVKSKAFSVSIKPCVALILAPADGTAVAAGSPLLLEGQGFWLEEARPELEHLAWHSSRDGALGQGRSLVTADLSSGSHEITLTAGRGKRAGTASITLRVT